MEASKSLIRATFGAFTGDAVYLGPTLYWHIKRHMLMSAAWKTQVAGSEVGPPALKLDLTDFSRNNSSTPNEMIE